MTDQLKELNKYMLYPKNMVSYLKTIIDQKSNNYQKEPMKRCIRYNKNYFVPAHNDKLFWIFYVIKYGFDSYELLGSGIFQEEKNLKLELITHVKAKTKMLKDTYKFKRLDVCESELLNDDKISFKTFHVLCTIHNIDIIFINDRIYSKLYVDNEEENENYTVIHKIGDDYVYEINPREEIITNYMDTKYEVKNYEKPIKSIGSYKLQDLKDIGIEIKLSQNDLNLKKAELYSKICETLNIEI
uniref:Uncharacterized protein n=1 Tax=viral metagenome TaxID=1070528 RepID=A0A6C0BTB5_9ZZZZ